MCISSIVVDEIRRIVKSSEIMKEDDAKWPQKNKDGRQELEIRMGNGHISFEVGSTSLLFRLRLGLGSGSLCCANPLCQLP